MPSAPVSGPCLFYLTFTDAAQAEAACADLRAQEFRCQPSEIGVHDLESAAIDACVFGEATELAAEAARTFSLPRLHLRADGLAPRLLVRAFATVSEETLDDVRDRLEAAAERHEGEVVGSFGFGHSEA